MFEGAVTEQPSCCDVKDCSHRAIPARARCARTTTRTLQRQISRSLRWLQSRSDTQLRVGYWIVAALAFVAILVVLKSTLGGNVVHTDDCLWTVKNQHGALSLVVTDVVAGGNADVAGIRTGDVVLAIGEVDLAGHNFRSAVELITTAQNALDRSPVGVPVPYLVRRDGNLLLLKVTLSDQLPFLRFLVPVLSFLWLVIGVTVVGLRPSGRVQRLFFLVAATVIFAFSILPPETFNGPLQPVVSILWLLIGCSFFVLWPRFCTIFPVEQRTFESRGGRGFFVGLTALASLNVILLAVLTIWGGKLGDNFATEIFGWTLNIANYSLRGIGFGAGVYFLFRGYRRLPASADRRPVTVILVGSILASAALVYTMIIQTTIAGVTILYPQFLLPVLLLLALPISFGYAVFRYQVMDLGRVLKTTLVYTATMALIAGLYLAAAYALGQVLGSLLSQEFQGTAEVLSFVLFVMLFEPLKRKVQTGIENKFFPQRRDYSGRLATYAAEITETIGAHAVAERTALALQAALDLRGVCVAIEDPNDGSLKPVARASEFAPVPVDGEAIDSLRHLFRQSHNLILLETTSNPQFENLQMYFPYVIGMYAQGRVTGAILMSRPHDDANLSGSQIAFIAGVAAQAAAALEVARLYEEELARQRYREELATARRIQESLLPAEMPDIPGITISAVSSPAQAVGGDYYDVIRLSEDRFLVTIADVSGKGLPASLYMAEFHGMVHVACGQHGSPKDILTTLNEHLFEVITRGSFITAAMLVFDTTRRSVCYARAGHTPIVRRGSKTVDTLIPTGVALGLCSRELFAELLQEYTVEYEPGETFILYSDGVSEAMNTERQEFGEGRLLDVVAERHDDNPETLRNKILSNVEAFRGTADQNDDITVVIVQIDTEADQPAEQDLPAATTSN